VSSRDGAPGDSLSQHRRELDGLFETLRAVREVFKADVELDEIVKTRLDTLADAVVALSNRVEALTRAVSVNAGGHSRRAGGSFYPSFCRTCGHHWESPGVDDDCPECGESAGDVVRGPFTVVVAS
jgi:rubrerythrin